jgi:hypothetical protein
LKKKCKKVHLASINNNVERLLTMGRALQRSNKYNEPFVGFIRSVLDSPALYKLKPHAYKLLVDLASQYRGNNNGDLTAAWAVLSKRGWRSKTTLWRCKAELINAGLIYVTRKGHMPSTCDLLALTWFPLDVSKKFDPEALACFRPWSRVSHTPLVTPVIKSKRDWTLPRGESNVG